MDTLASGMALVGMGIVVTLLGPWAISRLKKLLGMEDQS
jgi:hypothetical protein